jgi:hypothetical protein
VKPNQAADNPYCILTQRTAWVQHEFDATRGDRMGLHDYAKRFALMHNIQIAHGDSPALQKAMAYLLGMEKAIDETR